MKYIILAAGQGTRLNPITLGTAKPLFRLDGETSIIQRMVGLIRRYDSSADIIVVCGFMHADIKKQLNNVTFVYNPFYAITNSIASLWFTRHIFSDKSSFVIINADIVAESKLIRDVVCVETEIPVVLMDTSIRRDGDYNIRLNKDKVVVMSKELNEYDGEYAGITMLDFVSAGMLMREVENMIECGRHSEWYENALVQLIFKDNFLLYGRDISNYKWTEVDCVDDLLLAKSIHCSDADKTDECGL
jgi:choline kinase